MKTKIFSLLLATLLISSISFAKVWRVNNNTGVNANFATVNDAMASALVVNGDTLHVEASTIDYGGTDIVKEITLIGTGYYLESGIWPSPVQYNSGYAYFAYIHVYSNNVKLMGLWSGEITLNGPEANGSSNNSSITRCIVNAIGYSGTINNTFVSQNLIIGGVINVQKYFSGTNYPATNFLITNNIIGGSANINGAANSLLFGDNETGIIEYNDFGMSNTSSLFTFSNSNFLFRSNIVRATGHTLDAHANSSFSYNIAEQAGFLPTGSGNQNGIAMTGTSVFIDGTKNLSNDNGDSFYQLSATSPAKTAGAGGTPIGAYAGGAPYVRSGIPAIPTIYSLTLPSAVVSGNSVQVKFSSRSNQ